MEKKLLNLLLSTPQEQNVIHMGQKKKTFDLDGFEPTKTLFFTLCGPISTLGQSTQWEIKVPLRSKFCIPFFLQLGKVEVINTNHAKFYIEIPTGRPVILNAKFSFAVPPLLERQMAVNYIESWI